MRNGVPLAWIMVRKVLEQLVDDLDASPASQSVVFSLDSRTYQIDLNDRHAEELRATLGAFVDAARRVRSQPGGSGTGSGSAGANTDRNAAIRRWALNEGVELPNRGRVAAAVVAAFDDRDVDALYAATGLEREQPPPPSAKPGRRRIPSASFSTTG